MLVSSLTIFVLPSALAVTSVNLVWSPSPVTNITGYTVYYGVASRTYTNSIPVGTATNVTISGLSDGVIYYFAATAIDDWGLESDYSDEAATPPFAPTISVIPDQTTTQDTPTPLILFTVDDPATDASTLTVSASSSNPGLIPAGGIVFGGSGTNRSMTLTPASGQSGEAEITVTVSDGSATASTAFALTVAAQRPPPNTPPIISPIASLTITQNTSATAIPFTIGDAQQAAATLTLWATSTNVSLLPTNNILLGGSGSNRTVTLTPVAGQTGGSDIVLYVSDGSAISSTAFHVTVVPAGSQSALTLLVSGKGTLSPNLTTQKLSMGRQYTITATPSPGQMFCGWSGSITSSLQSLGFIMRSNLTFRANFAPLNLRTNGVGTFSPDLRTAQNLIAGKLYTITAVPGSGQLFAGWTGMMTSSTPQISFLMATNVDLQANFTPLNLRSSGVGTISPNLLLAQNLMAGKVYTITAIPGSGQLFTGWTGMITSTAPRISFLMASNVNLQANFIPNPFLAVQGTYNGLFHEDAAVHPNSAGSFTVTVTSNGGYSGSLQLGARRLTLSGQLGLQCQDTRVLPLSPSNTLTLSLSFGTGDQADTVSGTVTDGTWISALTGDRAVFNAQTRRAPFAGAYTLVLPGTDGDPSMPAGDGYGTVQVSTAGLASFSGTLADGTAVSQSATVSKDGIWPLYVPIYSGQGVLISWLAFTNLPGSDINGWLSWIKPAISNAQYYPAGFTQECEAIGSAYVQPARQYTLALTLTNAHLAFSGGNLRASFTNAIAVGRTGNLVNQSSNAVTLTVTPSNGTFKGRVTDPATRISLPFGGAVFQKQNTGYGSLMGTNQSSRVNLSP